LSGLFGWTAFGNASVYGWQVAGILNLVSLQFSVYKRARQTQRGYEQERVHLLDLLSEKNLQLEERIRARTKDLEGALKEVEKAEQDQRQLLSMASHEFRTPAAMIKASLDSLAYLKESITPEVDKRLNNIGKASLRLNQLANSLISHDRLQELSVRPKKTETDLCQLISSVLANYPEESPLCVNLPDRPVSFSLDPVLVTIALHNLIDNALRHIEADGTAVSVSLLVGTSEVELHVADQGPGIPDADKESIFERFFSSRGEHGAGLGLSIVQIIARSHGGRAYARDNAPKGAIMVISLAL
jgi:signal transduction histidine kinase